MLFWKVCSAFCFAEKVRNSKRLLKRRVRNFYLNNNVNRIQQVQLQIPLSDSYTDYAGLVPAHVPTSMSGGSNSGSARDDYDNPEDLWEDNRDWYEDEDEAWDEWENG